MHISFSQDMHATSEEVEYDENHVLQVIESSWFERVWVHVTNDESPFDIHSSQVVPSNGKFFFVVYFDWQILKKETENLLNSIGRPIVR